MVIFQRTYNELYHIMPATFHFYLREDRPSKKGLCPVYLRITHNRKMKYINTGIKLSPSDWNPEKEEVRRSHRTYDKLNQDLELILEDAQQARRELTRDSKVSAEGIKKRLQSASKDNFFTLANEYLDDLKYNKQYHTRKQSKVAIDKVKEFHGSEHLPLNLIDRDFLNRVIMFMKIKKKNMASTIHKNFGAIRGILDKAVAMHLLAENPVNDISLPKKNGSNSKAKLSFKQIQKIEKLKLDPGSNLWHSRNAFILAFYFCGVRFGDLAMLRWKNVKGGKLKYQMSKTGNEINVKIPDDAKMYLNYYDNPDKSNSDYIFPFLSDLTKEQQKDPGLVRKRIASWNTIVNDSLKTIAEKLKIDESLSMHVARHSFSQYCVEEKNVPVYRMMILLGHQNIKTTMQYLKTINTKVADETMDAIF